MQNLSAHPVRPSRHAVSLAYTHMQINANIFMHIQINTLKSVSEFPVSLSVPFPFPMPYTLKLSLFLTLAACGAQPMAIIQWGWRRTRIGTGMTTTTPTWRWREWPLRPPSSPQKLRMQRSFTNRERQMEKERRRKREKTFWVLEGKLCFCF